MRHAIRKPYVAYFIVLCLGACLLLPAIVGIGLHSYMQLVEISVGTWDEWTEALSVLVGFSVPVFVIMGLLGAWILASAGDDEHSRHRFGILCWGLVGGTVLLNIVYVQALWDVPTLMNGVVYALGDAYELFLYMLSESFVFGGGAIVGALFAAMIGEGHHGHHHAHG